MAITKRQRLEEQDQPGINRNCISNNDNALVTGGIGGVVEKEWRITHRVKGRRNIPTDSTMIVAAKYRIITRAPSRPPPVVASTSSTHKSAQQQEQQRQPEYSTAARATTRTESSGDDGFVVEPGLEDIPIFRAGSGAEANALRASPGYQSFYKACQQVWLDSNKGCKVGKRTVLELVQAKMGRHRRFVKQIAIPTTTTTTTTTTSSKTNRNRKNHITRMHGNSLKIRPNWLKSVCLAFPICANKAKRRKQWAQARSRAWTIRMRMPKRTTPRTRTTTARTPRTTTTTTRLSWERLQ